MRVISEFPTISVCTTSFNSAPCVQAHWESISGVLRGTPFEYIVVDNKSSDGTYEVLQQIASSQPNVVVVSKRCSRGAGRRLAAARARASTILCVDADTLYRPELRNLVDIYLLEYLPRGLALQVIYAGLYPRDLWNRVGGTRNLNYGEDLDLWIRVSQTGRMRWSPVVIGENQKSPGERDFDDAISPRYRASGRMFRLFRREIDMLRLRRYYEMDIEAIRISNTVDLHLGEMKPRWFGPPAIWTARGSARRITQGLGLILRDGL